MKRILAAIDFSDVTDAVIDAAADLARRYNASLQILHTELPPVCFVGYPLEPAVLDTELDARVEWDTRKLDAIRQRLAEAGVKAECCVRTGHTAACILDSAQRFGADLIVIGTHEHGVLRNLFLGGVRDDLISQAPCPVLIVPPVRTAPGKAAEAPAEVAEALA